MQGKVIILITYFLAVLALAEMDSAYNNETQQKSVPADNNAEDFAFPAGTGVITEMAFVEDRNLNAVELSLLLNPGGSAQAESGGSAVDNSLTRNI